MKKVEEEDGSTCQLSLVKRLINCLVKRLINCLDKRLVNCLVKRLVNCLVKRLVKVLSLFAMLTRYCVCVLPQ